MSDKSYNMLVSELIMKHRALRKFSDSLQSEEALKLNKEILEINKELDRREEIPF